MSISGEARRSDALALLGLLLANLGDAAIDCTFFDRRDILANVQETSWEELCSEGLLVKKTDSLYLLTANGWSDALIRAGVTSTNDFEQRVGSLARLLKDRVKGRHEPAVVPFDDIVQSSSLPSGWVFNVIDSHLIGLLHGRRDASWFEGARGRVVEIPRDFGLVKVDLFADIRADNMKLTEQIAEMEELYGDYRCPTCSAPMTLRTPWEHEYGTEEVTEYACGRTSGAPYGDAPCPRSRQFPEFGDFTLVVKQAEGRWQCFAPAVNAVQLMQIGRAHV